MSYNSLMYFHLVTVVPCMVMGAALFLMKKGTKIHKTIGKVYMILMMITGIITLFMPAKVGPQLFSHFGWIHSFSVLTLYSAPRAYFAIRAGNVKAHQYSMIGLYVGGILIAGSFTLVPGRFLHDLFFG
jgi:uncharacterized membrane protein